MPAQTVPDPITPRLLKCLPGIQRDGTLLDGDNCSDGQWTRFQRQNPRSMGGYRRLTNLLTGIPRGMNVFDKNNETYTHIGSGSYLQQMQIDPSGVVSSINDRTPAAFATDTTNLWQFDNVYDTTNTNLAIVAHAAPNATDISSSTVAPVYFGNATASAVLTATAFPSVSGGVCVSGPYTWAFGSDGIAYWSPANDPTTYGAAGSGAARLSASKVVRGMSLRAGAGNGPTTLFWTLSSLERATFVGGTSIFNFDTISDQSSILSAASVIEYNGVYFWIGIDSFLLYNGVVRELPNEMNLNYFFDNLNYDYRCRVYAVKFPRWGEIWWCYPRGSATECTHAIIYNVRENSWYDTQLPNAGRSCGQYAQVFRQPLFGGVDADTSTGSTTYKLWQHEYGDDSIDGTRVTAIQKYIETAEFLFPGVDNSGQPETVGSKISIISNIVEPDFVQVGNMNLVVKGRWNARSQQRSSAPYVFTAPNSTTGAAATSAQELITIRETARYMRFRFESNVQGGSFQWGKLWFHIQGGDGRIIS